MGCLNVRLGLANSSSKICKKCAGRRSKSEAHSGSASDEFCQGEQFTSGRQGSTEVTKVCVINENVRLGPYP